MKTEIRHSYVYEQIANSRKRMWTPQQYEKFKKEIKPFEKLYKKYIARIIKLIEKHTKNKKWEHDLVPIYLITDKNYAKDDFIGFSDPLTLRMMRKESPERILKVLVHELVHVRLGEKEQLKRKFEENERIVEKTTNNVWEELNIK